MSDTEKLMKKIEHDDKLLAAASKRLEEMHAQEAILANKHSKIIDIKNKIKSRIDSAEREANSYRMHMADRLAEKPSTAQQYVKSIAAGRSKSSILNPAYRKLQKIATLKSNDYQKIKKDINLIKKNMSILQGSIRANKARLEKLNTSKATTNCEF